MADPGELPAVTFGPIDPAQATPEWRNAPESDDDLPHEVLVAILGFDPLTVDENGDDINEVPK
jgi:hypothetical protein